MKDVVVLGQKYKIIRKLPTELVKAMRREGEECNFVALFMGQEKKIYVDPHVSNEEFWRALMHEMGHGVMYRNGVHFSGAVPVELEEIIVETFASAFYEFTTSMVKGWLKYDTDTIRDKLRSFVD